MLTRKSGLIVVDMQQRFLPCTNDGVVTANCVALMESYHRAQLPVFLTQHHDPDPNSVLYKWWDHPIRKESTDWQLLPKVQAAVEAKDILIQEKTTYDAFLGTRLQDALNDAGVEEVVICGCMTNLCCETTARSAFCRGFNVVFPRDGNGTLSPEMHVRSLANLEYGFAQLCDTADVLRQIQSAVPSD